MDDHHRHPIPPPLTATASASWPFFWEEQEEEAEEEELKQALLRITLELDATRIMAQEELRRVESQALHLAHLLDVATSERDEARHQCHSLLNLLTPANPGPNPVQPLVLDEGSNVAVPASSSSEEDESSRVSSPAMAMAAAEAEMEAAVRKRGLPEKGRLVEAVMGAGPLLQTLMLAGPLPRWRHPPPAMQSFEIPPVSVDLNPEMKKKKKKKREREGGEGFGGQRSPNISSTLPPEESNGGSSSRKKYQKIAV